MTKLIKVKCRACGNAMTCNEYAQALSGAKGKPLGLVDFNQLGTAVLEDAVAVRGDWIAGNEDLLVSFLKASIKGWVDARDNPAGAVQSVLKHGTALPEKFQTWQMNEINKLIWPSPDGAFTIGQDTIKNSNDVCYTYKVIEKPACRGGRRLQLPGQGRCPADRGGSDRRPLQAARSRPRDLLRGRPGLLSESHVLVVW